MHGLIQSAGYWLTTPDAVIYTVATALLYPVLIAEVVALVWAVFETGRFSVEVTGRVRRRSIAAMETAGAEARDAVTDGKVADAIVRLRQVRHGLYVRRFFDGISDSDTLERCRLLKRLDDLEMEASRRLDRTRMLIRIGPMLGLMGTLIPISPALVGLASGDVQTLSDNLVIAFSTTVVGLLIGGLAYGMSTVRERLYRQDVSDVEYLLEVTGL